MDYKIADINLAAFGRKELELVEQEMPGLMAQRKIWCTKTIKRPRISGSLHMTIQTAVLMETLVELGASLKMERAAIYSAPKIMLPPRWWKRHPVFA